MVSRRLIRIKAYQVLFAYYRGNKDNVSNAEKEVLYSVNKTYELYHKIFLLLIEIKDKFETKLEQRKNKKLPSFEDLNPNRKFVDNRVLYQLENTEAFIDYVDRNKISWKNNTDFIAKIVNKIDQEEYFNKYLNVTTDYKADKKLIIEILENIVLDCDDFTEILEEDSIYWNDELEFVFDMILRTFKKLKENHTEIKLMPLYKSDNDKLFAKDLVAKTILNHTKNADVIFKYIKNWDSERLAFTDSLLMEMAFEEFTQFNDIPVKVTMNEYIEIAKFYSTKQSGQFINGVLDKMVKDLNKEGLIKKSGLGLKGSI